MSTTDANDEIVFHMPMPLFVRLILGAAAAATFLAPWDLLIRPRVDPFQLGMLPFWFISAGALSIGVPMLIAAILGMERTVRFAIGRRQLIESGRTAYGLGWARAWSFGDIDEVVVEEDTFTENGESWDVFLRLRGRRKPFAVASRGSRAAAEALADRLRNCLQPDGDGLGTPQAE